MEADANPLARNMSASVDYLMGSLLEDRHYDKAASTLRGKWDRCQSMHAAMKLMEQHGVELSSQEEAQLSSLSEDQMIEALVSKMPPQSKEQFQLFFLQLQAVVSTATSVRGGLREGRPELVEAALEQAESTGVEQHILRMAIVQAGTEVAHLRSAHDDWCRDSQARMSKLLRGQEDKREAQRKLAASKAVLACHQASHSEKARRVLMGFAVGSTKTLLKSVFFAWAKESGQLKQEGELVEDYKQRLQRAEKKIYEARVRQLDNVRKMMTSKARECNRHLLSECWEAFRQEMLRGRSEGFSNAQVREMEARLHGLTSGAAQRAKGLMQRVSLSMDSDLLAACLRTWASEAKVVARAREYEEQVEKAKGRIEQLKEQRKSNAKSMLDTIMRDTNSGLLYQVLQAWQAFLAEERRINEMTERLHGANSQLLDVHGWSKSKASTITERAAEQVELLLVLQVFCNWRLYMRMEGILRQHNGKIESKRAQLGKVQSMFKDFAQEIEANFKASRQESDSDWHMSPQHRGGGGRRGLSKSENTASLPSLSKSENSVSLPSIHAKQSVPGSSPKALSRSPKAVDSQRFPVEDHRAFGDLSRQAWH